MYIIRLLLLAWIYFCIYFKNIFTFLLDELPDKGFRYPVINFTLISNNRHEQLHRRANEYHGDEDDNDRNTPHGDGVGRGGGATSDEMIAAAMSSSFTLLETVSRHQNFKSSSVSTSMRHHRYENIKLLHSNSGNKTLASTSTIRRHDVNKRSPINDVVSRNITMVLENLLKNYESSQLPTHGKGQPTIVRTNILIRSMGPVSELDMEYSMDCYFRQYWRDQRLSFMGPIKNLSLSIKMLERIWRPDTYFYNGKNSYVHTITVPNKLLRITQDGDILYSMRLTIKAKCPMELRNFPMDRQSCPLILGSYAYTAKQLVYQWQNEKSVSFIPGMALSQFDLISSPHRNFTFKRREGEFSVLQVSFNLQRHTGYFLIQVYVPCILIVVLSWVSFWIHREATSDRVGLCITTVLTLSTISLDSRTDLPKVRYATALDWFLLMSFGYCIATLLEFAGVHYFTKVGSGEIPVDEEEWEDCVCIEQIGGSVSPPADFIVGTTNDLNNVASSPSSGCRQIVGRRRSSLICPIYNDSAALGYSGRMQRASVTTPMIPASTTHTHQVTGVRTTMERTTQTEYIVPRWKQFMYCLIGDDQYRRQRQREAAGRNSHEHGISRHVNSVSYIDRTARILFPASFTILNICYWIYYVSYQEDFKWRDPKSVSN